MATTTKPGMDILQSYRVLASLWVQNIELGSVTAVLASVFLLKITYAQLVAQRIYADVVFGNEGSAITYLSQ